jgi:hypothetical protein
MTRIARVLFALLFCVLGSSLLAGCAQVVGDIDRTQPNAIKKALFVDEWYYQRTVVDVPASTGFTFVGNTDYSGMMKITWDIQEDVLFARRTTELLKGSSDKGWKGKDYQGEVVAAFRIEKHFDIIRQYSASTGEQMNVIEENSVDRPWYEREYIRVDWSESKVHNLQLDFESQSVESVPYYVQDTDPLTGEPHPDAPYFTDDGTYFDVTSKLFAKAGTIDIPGYGTVPLCWLRGEEFTECGAGEYSIRHSFLKLDPNRQYVPLPYKGKTTEVFGFFWTDQMVYDPETGIRVHGQERHISRHNLWKQWMDADGNEIPHAERALRPIVYHVNRDFPDDLKGIAANVAKQWNDVFLDVVKSLGHDPGDRDVFVLCKNNPVQEGDPTECGGAGNSPRIGDIRYSFMAYVPQYMTYGLLGLGPSNNDPETGEIISGMGYVYHHNNLAAFRTLEMIELLNGNQDPTDFINGVDLTKWVGAVNGNTEPAARTFGLEDAETMAYRRSHGWASKYWAGERMPPTQEDMDFQREYGTDVWLQPSIQDMYDRGIHNGSMHAANGKLNQLKGTYIEDLILDEEILMAGGHQPGLPVTQEHKNAASILRGGFGKLLKERYRAREAFAEKRNMYLAEMADDALLGLARDLKDVPLDEAYNVIRTSIYTAVLAHEVGHSLGLMHNFGGSDDAVNYHDGYWILRDDGNIGPRQSDPITDNEVNGRIYNYAYSSVMDYAGRYTIDGLGIGKYDRAAILFGYAQKMEVFKDLGQADGDDLTAWYDQDGDVLFFGANPRSIHYTTYYKQMGNKLYDASNRMLVDVADFTNGYSEATVDGKTHTRVPYIYCSHNRANLGDNCLTRDYGADSSERMRHMLDDLNTWYITRNFPRGKIGVDHYGYVGRYYGRIYDRLKNWNDLYSLYTDLLPRYYEPDVLQNFLLDPANGWGTKTWGVQNAFNYLVQTLLSPDVGNYRSIMQTDGNVMMVTGYNDPTLSLDVTEGRYYSTNWSFGGSGGLNCGYMWWECLHHIGFYLDKIMAIEALTDSETNFVARASPVDIRQWQLGYYNTYPETISKLNSAILGRDFSQVGPYEQGGQLRYPNYSGALTQTHNNPVDPAATFTVQLYWQLLGQARFHSNFDQSFVQESRVFVIGTGHEPTVKPSELVTFRDPHNGLTYGALKISGANGGGEALLNRANKLMSESNFCDSNGESPNTADDCCGNNCVSSEGWWKDRVDFDFLSHIEMVEIMADLHPMMTFGNPFSL